MSNDFKETLLFVAIITAIIWGLLLWVDPGPKQPPVIPPVVYLGTDVSAHYRTNALDLVYWYSRDHDSRDDYHIIDVIRDNKTVFSYEANTRDEAFSYMESLIAFERGTTQKYENKKTADADACIKDLNEEIKNEK